MSSEKTMVAIRSLHLPDWGQWMPLGSSVYQSGPQ